MGQGRVVNVRREQYDVYIGRPSEWGNPFVIGRDGTRAEVIAKYEAWMRRRLTREPGLADAVRALRGKRLGCWCAPKPCHGDVPLRLAEELDD